MAVDSGMNNWDVFISYSTKNKDIADAIVEALERGGVGCWYAPRNIMPGEQWATAIRKGLETASVFILIYTEASNRSEQVKNEVALAFNAGLKLVPFRLTEESMNPELEYYLMRMHWMDALGRPLEESIAALLKHTQQLLQKGQEVPEAAPERRPEASPADAGQNGSSTRRKRILPFVIGGAALFLLVLILLIGGRRRPEADGTIAEQTSVETETEPEKATVPQVQAQPEITQTVQEPEKAQASAADRQGKGGELWYIPVSRDLLEEKLPEQECFSSAYRRTQIASVTFCSEMPEAESAGIDLSAAGDGSVMAWFEPSGGGLYDLTIASDGKIRLPADCYGLFAGYDHMSTISFSDAADTSAVEDMSCMFRNCKGLRELDLSGFDTSAVTDLSYFVCGDEWMEWIDLESFDTAKTTSMRCMFWDCKSLAYLEIGGFDTSACTDMNGMFRGCRKLKELDVSGFDTSQVTDMFSMFYGLASLEVPLELAGFDTSQVTDMYWMFTDYPLAELDVSSFDTANVENMKNMFGGCVNLRELDLSGWDFSRVTNAEYMFGNDKDLTVYVDRNRDGFREFEGLERLLENAEDVKFMQKQ